MKALYRKCSSLRCRRKNATKSCLPKAESRARVNRLLDKVSDEY